MGSPMNERPHVGIVGGETSWRGIFRTVPPAPTLRPLSSPISTTTLSPTHLCFQWGPLRVGPLGPLEHRCFPTTTVAKQSDCIMHSLCLTDPFKSSQTNNRLMNKGDRTHWDEEPFHENKRFAHWCCGFSYWSVVWAGKCRSCFIVRRTKNVELIMTEIGEWQVRHRMFSFMSF